MRHAATLLVATLTMGLTASLSGVARCKYTVRDIGFVDLVGPSYSLVHVGAKDAQLASSTQALGDVLVAQGDLRLELVDAGDERAAALAGKPNGWLLERDGLAPLLLSAADNAADEERLRAAVELALRSPVRDELLAHTLDAFALVVLVESGDADADGRLAELVTRVRADLHEVADQLPRPIEHPLIDITITPEQRESERVLLWSLGLDVGAGEGAGRDGPACAVVYGRGKLAGSVMRGTGITRHELLAQLLLVGESCECDTERDWVNEPRVPLAWTDEHREAAAAELGFDPESPMVQSEVVRILERGIFRGADGAPEARRREGIEALVFGYRETAIETSAPEGAPETAPEAAPSASARVEAAAPDVYEANADDDWGFVDESEAADEARHSGASTVDDAPAPRSLAAVWIALASVAVLSALGGALVLARRRLA